MKIKDTSRRPLKPAAFFISATKPLCAKKTAAFLMRRKLQKQSVLKFLVELSNSQRLL